MMVNRCQRECVSIINVKLLVGTDFKLSIVLTSVQFRVRNGLGGHIADFNRTDNVDTNNRDLSVLGEDRLLAYVGSINA